jgi:glutathione synthase/RimK-type ligase-like ATP-grasp enzyme
VKNSQRIMIKIIKEICAESGIFYESYSYDWILRLTKNGKTVHVYGFQFENNSATAQLICTDKCAVSELLLSKDIPVVEHHFFITPNDMQYIGAKGNWQRMLDLLNQYGKLVCKPNDGTGGKDVYLVTSAADLEVASNKIFSLDRSIALSPYYEIEQEYRVILLNQEVKLVYSKRIQTLVGDGNSNIRQLFLQHVQSHPEQVVESTLSEEVMSKIPADGERIILNWKHNLGQGAAPDIIEDRDLITELSNLALKATLAVNVQFASVDIIRTGGKYLVLEINSGIMMETFAQTNDHNYQLAKTIYRQAMLSLMD